LNPFFVAGINWALKRIISTNMTIITNIISNISLKMMIKGRVTPTSVESSNLPTTSVWSLTGFK